MITDALEVIRHLDCADDEAEVASHRLLKSQQFNRRLLDFDLLARIKQINRVKLYGPGNAGEQQLQQVLAQQIAGALSSEVGAYEPGFAKAHAMRCVLVTTDMTPRHCVDLISAFKQDSVKHRYADWSELIDYCNRSAAPVGRFLLDLHGGSRHGYGPSDALCNALQILNHLQDCQDDYRRLDRVYLPTVWLEEEGGHIADLDRRTIAPALRRVVDRCLDGVDVLLRDAERLPLGLVSRRLGLESGAILDIARTLSRLLRRRDPLASRVQLGRSGFLWCCIRGAASTLF